MGADMRDDGVGGMVDVVSDDLADPNNVEICKAQQYYEGGCSNSVYLALQYGLPSPISAGLSQIPRSGSLIYRKGLGPNASWHLCARPWDCGRILVGDDERWWDSAQGIHSALTTGGSWKSSHSPPFGCIPVMMHWILCISL